MSFEFFYCYRHIPFLNDGEEISHGSSGSPCCVSFSVVDTEVTMRCFGQMYFVPASGDLELPVFYLVLTTSGLIDVLFTYS